MNASDPLGSQPTGSSAPLKDDSFAPVAPHVADRVAPRASGDGSGDASAPVAGRRARPNTARAAGTGIVLSLAIHASIAIAILGTAWSVSGVLRDAPPPVVLTADFEQPAPTRPRHAANSPKEALTPPLREQRATDETDAMADRLRALETGANDAGARNEALEGLARRFGASSGGDDAPRGRSGASFAGLVAGNATKVAYVVDASGSMVGSFPAIVDEVARSLERLEPTQQFALVCFRRDGAVAFGGTPAALHAASRAERAAAIDWLRRDVIPSGRSNPVEALSQALNSGADCIFLLSTTVTGPGRNELDRASMLALLDRLNPRDPRNGVRRAPIQCIQFLETDPGGTLAAVAAEHFGEGGFRYIPRDATTLDGSVSAPARTPTRDHGTPDSR
ncbi:MAG: hypothetical protein ACKO3W_16035 [bacterium]